MNELGIEGKGVDGDGAAVVVAEKALAVDVSRGVVILVVVGAVSVIVVVEAVATSEDSLGTEP